MGVRYRGVSYHMKKPKTKTGTDRRAPAGRPPTARRARSVRCVLLRGSAGAGRGFSHRERPEGFPGNSGDFPLAIFECNAEGRLTFANSWTFDYSGYTREDLERGIHLSDVIAAPDRSRAMKALQNTIAGGRSTGNEYTALRKDGSTFPVIIYAAPIVRDGRIVGSGESSSTSAIASAPRRRSGKARSDSGTSSKRAPICSTCIHATMSSPT